MFIPITKIDVEQRLVYGVATAETPDRAGEICDYVSTKPYFQAWSAEAAKNTGGKSLGNVRAMHGNVAAGKVTAIDFNDAEKKIEVASKIVDDKEWEKVLEGVYTGYSQGGRYVRRWTEDSDGGLTRFTAEPSEISLVDLPCLPEATFSIVKANGATEAKAFKSVVAEPTEDEIKARAGALLAAAQIAKATPAMAEEFVAKARAALVAEALAKAQLPTEEITKEAGVVLSDGGATTDTDGDDVKARAMEIATAQGAKHPDEQHFMAARAEILASKDPNPPDGPAVSDVKAAAAEAAKAANGAEDSDEVQQGFWDGEAFHVKKKDAEKAKRDRRAKKKLAEITGTVDATLEAINAKLGIEKTDYSTEARNKMASTGAAESDGSYPIKNATDLHNAFMDFHRGKGGDAKDRSHIVARAAALGLPNPFESADKAKEVADLAKVDVPHAASTVGHVHAQMAHFHARHFGAEQNPDMHKAAAGAHADAFLSQMHDQADCEQKSNMAWDATCKCYGMGKAAGPVKWAEMVAKADPSAISFMVEMEKSVSSPAAIGKALWPTIVNKLGKGLPTVARLAFLVDNLGDIMACVNFEEDLEADTASPLPGMLMRDLSSLCETLKAMADEEVRELLSGKDVDVMAANGPCEIYCAANPPANELAALIKFLKASPGMEKAVQAFADLAPPPDINAPLDAFLKAVDENRALEKKGARHNKPDQERVQKVHDLATDLGADCKAASSGKSAAGDDLTKAENVNLKELNAALEKKVAEYGPQLEAVLKRLEVVEAQPVPAKAAITAVDKSNDAAGGSAPKMSIEDARKVFAALTPEQQAHELMKLSLAKPQRI